MTARYYFQCWPPSVNHVWRKGAGRTYLDPKVTEFRQRLMWHVLTARAKGILGQAPIARDVALRLEFYPPTGQRRDLDNLLKSTLDAMTHAKVWLDDSQVRHITASLCEACPKDAGFWMELREI